MGILSAYAIYKYGKSRAKKEHMEEVCNNCGFKRKHHEDPDGAAACPV
jgi:hypothetical protein